MAYNSNKSGASVVRTLDNVLVDRINHGTSDTTFQLTPNKYHVWSAVSSLNITFQSVDDSLYCEYLFEFVCNGTTLTLPSDVVWGNGNTPTLTDGKTYQVSIVNNIALYCES